MTKAYFAAAGASVVADYVCYRYLRRPDGKNIGSKRIVPSEYYSNLDDVLDVIDAHTDAGETRDGFYRRFLRTEMLGRLDSPHLLTAPRPDPNDLLEEIRGLMTRRFPITVDSGLGATFRCRAALTREGTIEEVAAQAASIRRIQLDTSLAAVEVDPGAFHIGVEARLIHDGAPLTLDWDSDLGWLLPVAITDPIRTPEQRRVEDAALMSGDVVIRHRELGDEWYLPSPLEARIERHGHGGHVVLHGTACLDPQRAAGGQPLRPGAHDFVVRVQAFGLTRTRRLSADRLVDLGPPVLVDDRQQVSRLYATANNNLSANANASPRSVVKALRSARVIENSADKIALDLGVMWTAPPDKVTLKVLPVRGPTASWTLHPADPASTRWQTATSLRRHWLPSGEHRARLRIVSGGEARAVTLETPVPVTAQLPRSALPAQLRQLAQRSIGYLRRRSRR
jgi:hypothetical protein